MRIDFEPRHHVYSVNGEIASVSVTELLAKHGLAPDYSKADREVLRASADKGKEIHKDLENIFHMPKYKPKTEQGKAFKKWVDENVDVACAEQMLGFSHNGLTIAGTADIMGFMKDGTRFIGDHKTTSKFHREYVTWQVSILDYFARRLFGDLVNGRDLKWTGAKKFYCFHFSPELKVYELDKIEDVEIEKLLECELKGEKYLRPQLYLDKEMQDRWLLAEQILADKQAEYKKAEADCKEIREALGKAMEKQGVSSWVSPNKKIKATYVAPTSKIVVDDDKLMREYPFVYAKCQKIKRTNSYVRISVRKGE